MFDVPNAPPDFVVMKNAEPLLGSDGNPSKFWEDMKPYLRPMCEEDLKFLRPSANARIDMLPPLGKHYTERWLEDDSKAGFVDAEKLRPQLREYDSRARKNESVSGLAAPGFYTERLLSAFVSVPGRTNMFNDNTPPEPRYAPSTFDMCDPKKKRSMIEDGVKDQLLNLKIINVNSMGESVCSNSVVHGVCAFTINPLFAGAWTKLRG